jgi:hypothetical protein
MRGREGSTLSKGNYTHLPTVTIREGHGVKTCPSGDLTRYELMSLDV